MFEFQRISSRLRSSGAGLALAVAIAPVAAQAQEESSDGGRGLGNEIIVTAQKREQSLSDVSLSVSAVGAEALAETNTSNIEALQTLVPSISFGNDFNFAKLFIRGIGLSSSLPGVDPSVALHVDGVVVSLAQAQLGSMFDLERVEVLRGPQGTLYGRNATGGAVNLITAKPTDSVEGYARMTIGGPDLNLVGEAAVGGPLTDQIRARVAVRAVNRDGYGINEFTGNDIDNAKQFSTRAHLEFLPTDTLSVLLTGEYHTEDDRSLAIKFREISFPGVLDDADPSNDGLASLGQRDGASFASKVRNLNANIDPINDREQWALTGVVSLEASDDVSLKSLTSYRSFDAIFFHDFDMSSYAAYPLAQTPPVGTGTSANHWQPVFQHQFTQELQANIDTGRLHGVFGLFYLDERIRTENHIGKDVITNTDPFRVQLDGVLNIEAYAAFANLTFDLSDQFSIKAGGRYSHEKRHIKNNFGVGSSVTNSLTPDALQWDNSKSWNDFSPSLGLEYRPNDDLMFYGNWSRGFKSGTAEIGSARRGPPSVTTCDGCNPFVNPEKVEAFEAGGKYSGYDFSLNVAAFYQTLKNGQFQFTQPIPTPPFFSSVLRNAAESEAYGVDVEWQWRATSALQIDGSLAYLHSTFTKFNSIDPLDARLFAPGADPTMLTNDLSGNYTRMSPKWSFNLHPTYDIATGNGGSITLGTNFAYRSKQFHTEFNDPRLAQDGYAMVDANILYRAPNRDLTVNLWVKNIFDELVWAGSYAVATSRTIGGTLMPPRTYGVTLGYNF